MVYSQLWNVLDRVRGFIDPETVKEPFLAMLILKYLSTNHHSISDKTQIHLSKEANWDFVLENSKVSDLPFKLNKAFYWLEQKNENLKGVFSSIDFTNIFKSKDILWNLSHALSEIDIANIEESFGELFDKFIFHFAKLSGKKGANTIQSKELSILMQSFIPGKSVSIYNPFAGYASLAIDLPPGASYYGQEINNNTWSIAKMRLIAHGVIDDATLECEDSLRNWKNCKTNYHSKYPWSQEEVRYDFITGTPPFGMRVKDLPAISNVSTGQTIAEAFLIEQTISTLTEHGRAAIATSPGVLFRGGAEKKLRETLIREDLLEYVIGLPARLFSNTALPATLLVINKAKKRKGQVCFIDAGDMVVDPNAKERTLDVNKLLSVIESESGSILKRVYKSNIENEDFNLGIKRYFTPEIEIQPEPNEKLVKLGELVEILKGEGSTTDAEGLVVKTGNLSDDDLNHHLDLNEIERIKLPQNTRKIEESCLLLSLIGKSTRPTYFSFSGTPVYIPNNIVALRLNIKKVFAPFLINELQSDYVNKQLDAFRTGTAAPTLSRKDLLDVTIKLLSSKEQQEAKVKGIQEAYLKQKEKNLAYERRVLGLQEDSFREFASIKHTFRQYLNAMSSNVKGTKKFIAKNEGQPINLDKLYSKNLNQTFGEHLESLEETIQLMSKLISEFGDVKKKRPYSFVKVDELVLQAQRRFKSPEHFTFEELDIDKASFLDDDGNEIEPLTMLDEDEFNILFSNIISNAKEHGFKDPDKKYSIRTALSYDAGKDFIILEISNNGAPPPEKFSQKDLITRGEKTTDSKGAGTGGADIKDIINNFQGELEWINNPSDDFPVTYIVKLPLFKEVATL